MRKYNLGVIGFSEGNGHPYSWSAIFNGYNPEKMKHCEFPSIPEYLSKQTFPEDFLFHKGKVSRVWTQNKAISIKISETSNVKHVDESITDMIGEVDAVLLARDDAENHPVMVEPFLKAGLPVYIDKPFALSIHDGRRMLGQQLYNWQIFTCSALRYATELQLSEQERKEIGTVQWVEAKAPHFWETYSIHLLEPIIVQCSHRGDFKCVKKVNKNGVHHSYVEWQNLIAQITMTGSLASAIGVIYHGTHGKIEKTFKDSFKCFKLALDAFLTQIESKELQIPESEVMELVSIIESGR